MPTKDLNDHRVSGADAQAIEQLEAALYEFRCYIRDPVATINAALERAPEMVMGHVLHAYLHLLGTEPAAIAVAKASCERAAKLPGTDREQRHLEAVRFLCEGRWRDAGRTLEDLSIEYPRDTLALQTGHQIDFFLGDSRMLRDRIARALPAWSPGVNGYGAVLGMYAFGLEETGHYALAEANGRHGVELDPRDGWSQHAVAHVMEMQCRARDGINWMRANPQAWSNESFFAVHNWWHLALYHLDLGEIDEVLKLHDGPIRGNDATVILEMIDASAMLWRLMLRGVDVGNRWQALADHWLPVACGGNYAFNDMHAMMAFAGAGRKDAQEALLQAQAAALETLGDNPSFIREVGRAATLAMQAFSQGNYRETVRLLRPIRHGAHRFGGSHAQRDVLDLTLIEAAFRGGETALARALAAERLAAKPQSAAARQLALRGSRLPTAA
ncbi:MAG: tetratricopeptide repeat protein [Betaproteobacteria bacterium]|nr:tetratricopeptide repeat protein [Betaproteobacteria bacterium]